ncbi:MAG: radical SAM family heme chaperone HemW [Holosporales bacterium]
MSEFHWIALYIHYPFCLKRCPYCDYNVHLRGSLDEHAWLNAYRHEIQHYQEMLPHALIGSVFFGGGTPSLLPAASVAVMLNDITRGWKTTHDLEITLEANPTSTDAERLQGYRAAGVNRVSLGVQSLRDEALQFLGRAHNAAQALDAIHLTDKLFHRWSFDLITARPNQTLNDWENELTQALHLLPKHLSIYQLTIEENTPFFRHQAQGKIIMPDAELAADFFKITNALCMDKGLYRYEVSSHAVPNEECRHNLAYWRLQDYIGIGAGAHGRITMNGMRHAATTHTVPEKWQRQVLSIGHGRKSFTALNPKDIREEAIIFGLRSVEGLNKNLYTLNNQVVSNLIAQGLLEETATHIRVTPTGLLVLNWIETQLSDDS